MAERSLMEVARARTGGAIKAGRVLAFMIAWQRARVAMGEDWPEDGSLHAQVLAYAAWWRQGERTVWREVARFRVAFPAESTPSRLMDEASWDERRGVAGLGAVVVS